MGLVRPLHRKPGVATVDIPVRQRWWTSRRFGLLVHPSAASVPGWAPIGQYAEWYRAHLEGDVRDTLLHPSPMVETIAHHTERWGHVAHFDDFADLLTYDEFDADEWAELATAAGMTYTVIVAKHHDGLCWWDAPHTDFTVLEHGPHRDVLGEYATACERAGLAFGTYYSLLDWHDPAYPSCAYVDDIVHPQVLDLVERYGSRMLWGDGHWGGGGSHWRSDDLIEAARAIDASVVVNDRWWADGPGVRSFEYRLPADIVGEPWEMRRGMGGSFGYNRAERSEHLLDAHAIVALLTEVVAKGGHLLIGVGPDASGTISDLQAAPLRAAGTWIRAHADLIESATPWTTWGDAGTRYLVHDSALHAIDVDGTGRFAQLGQSAGRVTAVARVVNDERGASAVPVEFEQHPDHLTIGRRSTRHALADPIGVTVYRIGIEPIGEPPIELFDAPAPLPIELAPLVLEARPGQIVQLGNATYIGPARIPAGVVVRGLGPARTTIDGSESCAITLEADARVEHCTVQGGGTRIVWLPTIAAVLAGPRSSLLGCTIDGHVEFAADDCRITSCAMTGIVARSVDRVAIARSSLRGMNWDCAIDIEGGVEHLIDGCTFADVLEAVRLTGTSDSIVRGNRVSARWWGVRAIESQATLIAGNTFAGATRAVDIDGGSHAVVTGNLATDGDSGCVLQRGTTDAEIAGNRWERTRIGLLAWDAGPLRHHDNTAVALGEPEHAVMIGP
jgi:alpha-L-fucosidase